MAARLPINTIDTSGDTGFRKYFHSDPRIYITVEEPYATRSQQCPWNCYCCDGRYEEYTIPEEKDDQGYTRSQRREMTQAGWFECGWHKEPKPPAPQTDRRPRTRQHRHSHSYRCSPSKGFRHI